MLTDKRKQQLLLLLAGIVMLLAAVRLINSTLAKYSETASANSDPARVAIFAAGTETLDLTFDKLQPGDVVEKEIIAVNTENGKTAEVTLKYTLELIEFGDLPLEYELYKVNGSSEEKVDFKDSFEMDHGSTVQHNFKLKATWPKSKNDVKYSEDLRLTRLYFHVTQVD